MSLTLYNTITLKPTLTNSNNNTVTRMYKGFSTIQSSASEQFGLYDFQLIQQDLLNMFNVRQGERLMNPTFGTVIWDLLFEPLTDEVRAVITKNVNDIINFDPRVTANQVVVSAYETGIQIECTLTYLPYNVSQTMQLSFDQANSIVT